MQLQSLLFAPLLFNWAACSPQQHPLPSFDAVAASAPPYRKDLLDLHRSLVEIESITGNEHKVGSWLAKYLEQHSWEAYIQPVESDASADAPNRNNVIAFVDNGYEEIQPRLMVTSHIDVVPPYIPYSTDDSKLSSNTTIRGRGSVDAKASVAAQLIAVQSLIDAKEINPHDVLLGYVVGEETNGAGMRKLSADIEKNWPDLDIEAVIFGEPTEGKLACGHKGHLGCWVHAKGKAGHSGYPWLGKSANEVMVRALSRIMAEDLGSSEEFGNTTVNIGTMDGGVAENVIAEKAEAHLAIRVATGPQKSGADKVRSRVEEILQEVDDEALSMTCDNGYGAVKCDCEVDGFDTITVNYGTDVPNLKGNHTRYLYGPGSILVAHSADEALKVKDLEDAVEGYKRLIKHVLSSKNESF
jgi:acetylornithine deacetylase